MYIYDEIDQRVVDERVENEQGGRLLHPIPLYIPHISGE